MHICKNICVKTKVVGDIRNKYSEGAKRCCECCVFFMNVSNFRNNRCPCCGSSLRSRRRHKSKLSSTVRNKLKVYH